MALQRPGSFGGVAAAARLLPDQVAPLTGQAALLCPRPWRPRPAARQPRCVMPAMGTLGEVSPTQTPAALRPPRPLPPDTLPTLWPPCPHPPQPSPALELPLGASACRRADPLSRALLRGLTSQERPGKPRPGKEPGTQPRLPGDGAPAAPGDAVRSVGVASCGGRCPGDAPAPRKSRPWHRHRQLVPRPPRRQREEASPGHGARLTGASRLLTPAPRSTPEDLLSGGLSCTPPTPAQPDGPRGAEGG